MTRGYSCCNSRGDERLMIGRIAVRKLRADIRLPGPYCCWQVKRGPQLYQIRVAVNGSWANEVWRGHLVKHMSELQLRFNEWRKCVVCRLCWWADHCACPGAPLTGAREFVPFPLVIFYSHRNFRARFKPSRAPVRMHE